MIHLFLFLFFLAPGFLPAAERVQEELMPTVVVTATRTEISPEHLTTSLSVITSEEIQARQSETVLELLRSVPGVHVVQSGSRGTNAAVSIRGSDPDQVLVMVDGVEVNSTTQGFFNFAHLTTEHIERIEILRGSGGALYGSQSIGGVINIITKKGAGSPQVALSAAGGNGHTHRQTLGLQGARGNLAYALSAARLETRGFHRFNDDYQNLAASGRLDYRVTQGANIRGIFHFVKTDTGFFNSNNFVPGATDPNSREAVSQYTGKLEWEQKVLPNLDYRVSGSVFKEHIKNSDDPDSCMIFGFPCDSRSRSRFRPQIGTAEFQTNYRVVGWSTTTAGVEFKRRKASTSSSSDSMDLGGIDRAVRNMGYYLQQQVRFFDDRLILIPGVRLDDHQNFGTEWSPSFSAAYLFEQTQTKIKAGYAEGFRAPTLNELFFPPGFGCAAFGNPDLGPERSQEFNAGVEQHLAAGRIKLGATYFHREVEDLVSTGPTPDPSDPAFCVRAENIGQARFDGVEWQIGWKLASSVSVGANYTYLDWDTESGRLRRQPRHRGSFQIDYENREFQMHFSAHIVGRRDDRDSVTGADIAKASYARFDLAGSYVLPVKLPLTKSVKLFGRIENLLNRKYEETDGFRARPLNFLIGVEGVFGSNGSVEAQPAIHEKRNAVTSP